MMHWLRSSQSVMAGRHLAGYHQDTPVPELLASARMSVNASPTVALPEPTRVRYLVLAFLGLLAFILYVDRICISKAVTAIEDDLKISHTSMSYVLAAFTLAYCLFEVPAGAWGDRYGSRGVLARIVVWWSVFTALTAAAMGLWSLLAIRFLFGAGEAGAFPNTARILSRWFPAARRGPAQGFITTMALVGAAFTPTIAGYLIDAVKWQWTFVIFSLPGFLWAAVFYWWYRDDPAKHPAVNEAELRLIHPPTTPTDIAHPPIPWRLVVRNANVWLLGGVIACSAFNTYLYFSWYPTYLEKGRGVDNISSGWLASLVLAGGAVGGTLGGFLSDALIRRTGNRRASRRILGCFALSMSAVWMLAGLHTGNPVGAACWTALAVLTVNLTLASWWGAVADISGRHVGALFGLMNSIGGVGAIASQLFLGRFADWMGDLGFQGRAQWDPAFYLYAGILLIGACGWLAIDTTRAIEPAEPPVVPEPAAEATEMAIMDREATRGIVPAPRQEL
jgi:MFS family permease